MGACSPRKASVFPQTYSKFKLTLTPFPLFLLFKISTVSFRNEILEALKSYFSNRDEKNSNLVQVHQFKCTGAEVYSLLKASLLFGES